MERTFSACMFTHLRTNSRLHTPTWILKLTISYATVTIATPQWYQTPNMVAAFIKLKGIPPDRLSAITACFRAVLGCVSHLMSPCYPPPSSANTPSSLSSLFENFVCVRVHKLEIQPLSTLSYLVVLAQALEFQMFAKCKNVPLLVQNEECMHKMHSFDWPLPPPTYIIHMIKWTRPSPSIFAYCK